VSSVARKNKVSLFMEKLSHWNPESEFLKQNSVPELAKPDLSWVV
jgi:hypothetical protein